MAKSAVLVASAKGLKEFQPSESVPNFCNKWLTGADPLSGLILAGLCRD